MHHKASRKQIDTVIAAVRTMGLKAKPIPGSQRTAIGVLGNKGYIDDLSIRDLPGVKEVIHVTKPYKMVSRDFHPKGTVIKVANIEIGAGKRPIVIADLLRGGAFKPRTGPHTFQGLEREGLRLLSLAKKRSGLPIVTEVMTPENVALVEEHADVLQVGARNMQNFDLLKELGRIRKPVLLKRGMSATIEEFLAAAEYIYAEGNPHVILCERGIRTFETATRNSLDLSVIPLINELSHLPVIIDPSHATGKRSLVPPMSKAALVAGAHGIMVEVHPEPDKALSDGPQSLSIEGFGEMMKEIKSLISFLGFDR